MINDPHDNDDDNQEAWDGVSGPVEAQTGAGGRWLLPAGPIA